MVDSITGKDICAIVKACAASGVREITIGQISIKFGPQEEESTHNIHYQVEVPKIESTHYVNSEENDSTTFDQDELDQIKITDPAEYERIMTEEDLDG